MNKGNVKLWQGFCMLGLGWVLLFKVAPLLTVRIGLYGTLVAQWLLVLLAVLILLVGKSSISEALPLKKPKIYVLLGTLLIWGGTYWLANLSTYLLGIFFPQDVSNLGSGLGQAFTQEALWVSILIIAVTPAICEEIMFRGVVQNSFRLLQYKWLIIFASALIFGLFHGSVFRLLPPTMLGIAMGYIFFETDNMIYNMLFHLVNNIVPLVLLYGMEWFLGEGILGEATKTVAELGNEAFLTSFGSGILFAGGALFCIYIGRHFLHLGQAGYEGGLFPKERHKDLIILIVISVICFGIGIFFIFRNAWSIFPEVMEGMNEVYIGIR